MQFSDALSVIAKEMAKGRSSQFKYVPGYCSVLVRVVDGQLAGEVPVSTSVYSEDYVPSKLRAKYAINWKKVEKDTKLLTRAVPKKDSPKAYEKHLNELLAQVRRAAWCGAA